MSSTEAVIESDVDPQKYFWYFVYVVVMAVSAVMA